MALPQPDLVKQPFANTGTKNAPPQTDPNGFVNFTTGYTSDYEIDILSGNPQAKGVELGIQNYLFNQSTMAIQAWQQAGFSPWFATMPNGYQVNAFVIRQATSSAPWLPYRSLVANNVSDPLNSPTQWEYVQGAAEMINNIPMPAGGTGGPSTELIIAATNFNTFVASGTWEFQTDAIVAASGNSPSSTFTGAAAGMLEVMPIASTGGNNYILQRYFDRNGVLYTRSSANGAWSAWNVMPNFTQVSAGRYAGVSAYNASQTILSTQGGYAIQWFGGAGGVLTLPLSSAVGAAIPFTFFNQGSAPVTVSVTTGQTPAQFINTGGSGQVASVVLQIGDSLQVTSRGGQEYDVTGGTAEMQFVVNPKFIGTANFAARPVFNGQTPWDSSNLPNPFQTTGGIVTGATSFNSGGVTFNTNVTMAGSNNLVFAATNGGTYQANMRADGGQFVGITNQANSNWNWQISEAGFMSVRGGAAFGARPTWVGLTPWDNGSLPNPFQTTGGTIVGQTDFNGVALRMLNGGGIQLWSPGNTSFGVLGGYAGGVGFLNQASSAWNMQISDGGTVNFNRARPTWAGLTPWDNGNFNPAAYQPAGSYLVNGSNGNTAGLRFPSGSPPSIASASFGQTALQIANGGNNAASASMTFIRDSVYGVIFGLDTDNVLKVGGGSMGPVSYQIWHAGNITPATAGAQVVWNTGITELAGVVTGADVTVDAGNPWVLEGLRTNGGNNRIFMRVVWLRNQ